MLDAGKLADNACSAISYQASLHRLNGSCGMQYANKMLEAGKLATMHVQQPSNQALWKLASTWAVRGGGFKKERKRGQTLKACPLLKGLKQTQPRGRRFNQD